MTMLHCRGCGHSIHCTAPACPKCGAVQDPALEVSSASGKQVQGSSGGLKALKIVGGTLGVLFILGLLGSVGDKSRADGESSSVAPSRAPEGNVAQSKADAAEVARVLSEDPFILGAEVFVRELQSNNNPMCQQLGQFAAQRLQMVRSMHKQHAERAMVEMYEIAEQRGCV